MSSESALMCNYYIKSSLKVEAIAVNSCRHTKEAVRTHMDVYTSQREIKFCVSLSVPV